MNEMQSVEQLLVRTARRKRFLMGWRGFWQGLLVGAAVYLLGLVLYKALPISAVVLDGALWMGAAMPIAGFILGFWRPVSRNEAARILDLRAGLQERLSTALEVSDIKGGDSHWRDLVVRDATSASTGVDPRRILPVRLPPMTRWAAIVLAAAAGLGFAPEFRTDAQQQKANDAMVIKDTGRNLVQVTKRELVNKPPVSETARQALDDVGELGERLQAGRLTRDDALRDLAKTTESMRREAQELAKDPGMKRLQQAARNSGSNPRQTSQALQRQMEALQKALGDKAADADAARDLKKDLEKLQEAGRAMAQQDGAAAAEARQGLAQALSELGQKAMEMGIPMESLDEAAAALASANVEQFLKNLDIAEKDLDELADMARAMAQMQQQAQQLGKDLAEQLQNGQAEAAMETLQKMIEQLAKSGVSPQEMAKIASEAMKASKAGQQYGKVGELLKQAAGQCESGASGEAASSLEAAREELARLMDQMGDAEAMMAALQALQKAQACIGNGQCWGQGSKDGPIAAGKSAKGGRGVGTWSDNDAWAMPETIQDLWDNSGINRPDMAERGLSDRDPSMPDNLVPTKIKGDIQPGGPMPSITLRGVSIKGESKVEYTEAIATAQGDARAALNQEEVPKSYRNSVRDYFDDLK